VLALRQNRCLSHEVRKQCIQCICHCVVVYLVVVVVIVVVFDVDRK